MNYYNTGKSKYLLSLAYSLLPPLELASWTTIEWQGAFKPLLYHWIACVLSGRRPGRDGITTLTLLGTLWIDVHVSPGKTYYYGRKGFDYIGMRAIRTSIELHGFSTRTR